MALTSPRFSDNDRLRKASENAPPVRVESEARPSNLPSKFFPSP